LPVEPAVPVGTGGPVLVVNPGSSSLKLVVVGADDQVLVSETLGHRDGQVDVDAIDHLLDRLPEVAAAGVRVVHGGDRFRSPTVVDAAVLEALSEVSDLAPLHNPPALSALRSLASARPDLPLVACFDTAFHAGLPTAAATYALPYRWRTEWGIRRYGFHGLSHAYATRRAARLLRRPVAELALVTCHLGAGASLAAVDGGRSVDTTMGYTPMDGLVMATRSGSVDPGALLWVMRRHGVSPAELETTLDRRSGLAGLSGEPAGDLRAVLVSAEGVAAGAGFRSASRPSGTGGEEPGAGLDPDRARLAVDVYLHRLRAGIAAMVAALGRLDAVVFTGGVGEASPVVRSRTIGGLGFLGLRSTRRRTPPPGAMTTSPSRAEVPPRWWWRPVRTSRSPSRSARCSDRRRYTAHEPTGPCAGSGGAARVARTLRAHVPAPVADLGEVFAVLVDVAVVLDQLVA